MKKLIFFCFLIAIIPMVLLTSCQSKSGKKLAAQTLPEVELTAQQIEGQLDIVGAEIMAGGAPDFPVPQLGEGLADPSTFTMKDWKLAGSLRTADPNLLSNYVWIAYPWYGESEPMGFIIQFQPGFAADDVLEVLKFTSTYEKRKDGSTLFFIKAGVPEGGEILTAVTVLMKDLAKSMGREEPILIDYQ